MAVRGDTSSPTLDQQSTQVFENLAKRLHRLESKLGGLSVDNKCQSQSQSQSISDPRCIHIVCTLKGAAVMGFLKPRESPLSSITPSR